MISRRGLFAGALSTTVAGGSGLFVGNHLANVPHEMAESTRIEHFRGPHQNGIELELQNFTAFVSLNLRPTVTKVEMRNMMALLTDDIDRLSQGKPVLADPHPELISGPSGFTATIGFGSSLFAKLGLEDKQPPGFKPLPEFGIDRLEHEFSGGDLLLHISCDDPIFLSHAMRMLVLDSQTFASVHFVQQGFAKPISDDETRTRQRNLMGQIDGTENPKLGSGDFADLVWIADGPDWIRGGTTMVLRRIAMRLNTWDTLGRNEQEQVIGRTLDTGAPLSGITESDIPDFNALDDSGLSAIPKFAHIRRATAYAPSERFFRRPFNYDLGFSNEGEPQVGLLWTAYARNLEQQYLPVQKRLASFDLLNTWTVPIGSSIWAIPRGVGEGEIIAESLFA